MESEKVPHCTRGPGMINLYSSGYSTGVDGPGTRLIYYLKGCNFRCDWCGAPESISPESQVLHYPDRTVHAGEMISTDQIFRKVLKAGSLISGVTFGGGEPTLQAGELIPLLEKLNAANVHTAMESNASTALYPEVARRVNLVYSDLKTLDEERFVRRISPNADLLNAVRKNLRFAALNCPDLVIRIPVVRDLNDDEASQSVLAGFLEELASLRPERPLQVQLLRQHHLAEVKYRALGISSACERDEAPPKAVLERFAGTLRARQIRTTFFG